MVQAVRKYSMPHLPHPRRIAYRVLPPTVLVIHSRLHLVRLLHQFVSFAKTTTHQPLVLFLPVLLLRYLRVLCLLLNLLVAIHVQHQLVV